jgi:perosamine synthetase
VSLSALPYGRQWIDDDDVAAVIACLRGDWLTQGPTVEAFEQALCAESGAKHAIAVASGTAALHLAALIAGIGPGDTGVTSAITFTASANCIAYCGGRVEFADVDPDTALIDLNSLENCVRKLTAAGTPPKVIIPVDLAGQPADLQAVRIIADRCGAKVISDAAHSLGARYRCAGQAVRAGSCVHSDLAIFSFHPVKQITTAEGGALLTNDASLASRARVLRTHGIHKDPARLARPDEGPWYYEQAELGFHYRISDLQCALGLSQIKKLDQFVERRNAIASRYDVAFAKPPFAGWLTPLRQRPETVTNAYHLYVVKVTSRRGELLEQVAARRKALYLGLRERKIVTQVHYIPVPIQPYYGGRGDQYPKAMAYYTACLSLPMFPKMTDGDADQVISALAELAGGGE